MVVEISRLVHKRWLTYLKTTHFLKNVFIFDGTKSVVIVVHLFQFIENLYNCFRCHLSTDTEQGCSVIIFRIVTMIARSSFAALFAVFSCLCRDNRNCCRYLLTVCFNVLNFERENTDFFLSDYKFDKVTIN